MKYMQIDTKSVKFSKLHTMCAGTYKIVGYSCGIDNLVISFKSYVDTLCFDLTTQIFCLICLAINDHNTLKRQIMENNIPIKPINEIPSDNDTTADKKKVPCGNCGKCKCPDKDINKPST